MASHMKQPSPEELEEMIPFIAHEYALFDVAYETYQALLKKGKDDAFYGEAFILHFRNLYSFLFRRRDDPQAQSTDVFASEYRESWTEKGSGQLGDVYRKAHVQLAHISTDRLPQNKPYEWKTWQKLFPTIHQQITVVWEEFLAVPKHKEELQRKYQEKKKDLLG